MTNLIYATMYGSSMVNHYDKTPEWKEMMSQLITEKWRDPEYRFKTIAGIKESRKSPNVSGEFASSKRQEVRMKQSRTMKAKYADPEYKARWAEANRISAQTREIPYEERQMRTAIMKARWADPDMAAKMSIGFDKWNSLSDVEKDSIRNSKPVFRVEKPIESLPEKIWKGQWADPIYRAKMLEIRKTQKQRPMSSAHRKMHSERMKAQQRKLAETPEGRMKMLANIIKNAKLKPNKSEQKLDRILQFHQPDQWRFVGDGQLWIAGMNPDFVHMTEKKVIELFGRRWHASQNPENYKRTEIGRITEFAKEGWIVTIIYDDELKDESVVLSKLGLLQEKKN